ncbi:hypothetical protein BAUCODRAFT_382740 [Baudoinia panamericana UAMH 10762]|uniref:Uncharacterized protein n=1 Tax=Baudoinia panamericana (strain UAMH 10762) TaxID=717646 RepID=M2N4F4_BAUPA|nr:uncharacterized protein BAUCODRAFT_382740 [Baudoinia panamericana UAMH 10762]EMC98868.1 hypothetical protein BAUCODRAFT_382740 [Baudoinia panamericana UAMH 10762]
MAKRTGSNAMKMVPSVLKLPHGSKKLSCKEGRQAEKRPRKRNDVPTDERRRKRTNREVCFLHIVHGVSCICICEAVSSKTTDWDARLAIRLHLSMILPRTSRKRAMVLWSAYIIPTGHAQHGLAQHLSSHQQLRIRVETAEMTLSHTADDRLVESAVEKLSRRHFNEMRSSKIVSPAAYTYYDDQTPVRSTGYSSDPLRNGRGGHEEYSSPRAEIDVGCY